MIFGRSTKLSEHAVTSLIYLICIYGDVAIRFIIVVSSFKGSRDKISLRSVLFT